MDEDRIINKLIVIEERLNSFATKSDLENLENRLMTHLDQQSVISKRLDEERHFTVEWVRRIEADVDRIKTHLQIA